MAYPTAAQFTPKCTENVVGFQPFTETSTTQKHALGTVATGMDFGTLGYGAIAAIYLKGVASTAAGDLVIYDPKLATTTRTLAASRGPVAVALSANIANQYGWYAVEGDVPVSTTAAGTGAANALLAVTATDGRGTVSGAAGIKIDNAICKAAQDTPSSGFTQVLLSWPAANGNT
jgi:hypothetical protein